MKSIAAFLGAAVVTIAAPASPIQGLTPPQRRVDFSGCREVTVVYQNVSAEAERSLLPSGYAAIRNNVGRPSVWLENLWCESVDSEGLESGPGGYTMLLAQIVPPDGSDMRQGQHFYIVDAFTSLERLQAVLMSIGVVAEVVPQMSLTSTSLDDATFRVDGSSPFTVSFSGVTETTVHTHNWHYWHESDQGRAVTRVAFTGQVGRRGNATFSGAVGTKLNDTLANQPIRTALSEPSSAQMTLTLLAR